MFKIGDIIHTENSYEWFSYSSDMFHHVPKKEAFFYNGITSSSKHIELKNLRLGYEILIPINDFNMAFNIKTIRKEKLNRLYEKG